MENIFGAHQARKSRISKNPANWATKWGTYRRLKQIITAGKEEIKTGSSFEEVKAMVTQAVDSLLEGSRQYTTITTSSKNVAYLVYFLLKQRLLFIEDNSYSPQFLETLRNETGIDLKWTGDIIPLFKQSNFPVLYLENGSKINVIIGSEEKSAI